MDRVENAAEVTAYQEKVKQLEAQVVSSHIAATIIGKRMSTLHKENFLWNLNIAFSLVENLLNLNSVYLKIFINLSMIAYIIRIQKSNFANI